MAKITPREEQAALVAYFRTGRIQQAAAELGIAARLPGLQKRQVMAKSGGQNTAQLICAAIRRRIIDA
jgi:hypothetical protein